MKLGKAILALLFPPKCAFCSKILERDDASGICTDCREKLPRASAVRRKCDFIASVSAPLYYEGVVRKALLRYKFDNTPALSRPFGKLMAEKLREDWIAFDILTWVPLSRKRLRKRGYDQARLLAESTAEELHCTAVPTLRKTRHIRPQSLQKTPEARRANISGCFTVLPEADIAGKRILLVDDIVTTGATVSECARMLLLGGAEEVRAASLACRPENRHKE